MTDKILSGFERLSDMLKIGGNMMLRRYRVQNPLEGAVPINISQRRLKIQKLKNKIKIELSSGISNFTFVNIWP